MIAGITSEMLMSVKYREFPMHGKAVRTDIPAICCPAVAICQTFFSEPGERGKRAGEGGERQRGSEMIDAILMDSSLSNFALITDNEAITAECDRH